MSLTPESSPGWTASQAASPPVSGETADNQTLRARRWPRWTLAMFTLLIGLFLAIFPWTDYWNFNYFQDTISRLDNIWDEPSFRAAFTALGCLNIYIASLQFAHLFRRN